MGTINTAGDVTTTNDNVTYASATALTGNVAVDTGAGVGTITFTTLDATVAETLDLDAGTGNIDFDGVVGGGTRLGAMTIADAGNVTADFGITAASFVQTTGSGTTTFTGAVDTNAAAGVNVTNDAIALDNTINTTNLGTVTLTADTNDLDIAAAGDITADGAVTLSAVGTINTAGDVTTTNDNVTYASATALTGNVAVDTGAGVGTITFTTLDATVAETLDLDAGTGNIDFDGVVGGGTRLGAMTIADAGNVTADLGITAASFVQTTGSGTTTFTGAVDTNAAAGVNVTNDAIALDNTINTTNLGTVTLTADTNDLDIAAAGDITADGAVTHLQWVLLILQVTLRQQTIT